MKTNKAKKEFWDFVIESCSKFIWHNAISPNHPQGFAPRSSLFRWQECLISVFHHYCYLYFGRIITEKICVFFFFFPAAPLPPPVVTGLEHPTLLLYPFLAVSLVLLFSSLSLALVVFLRSPKTQAANSRSKEANRGQECTVQLCQEVSPSGQRSEGSHELTVRPRLPVREWLCLFFSRFCR